MHPVRLDVYKPVALLEEDNVARYLRTGSRLEGVVGQSDRAQQVGSLRDIFPHGGVFLIQRAFAGNKGDNAARPDLIQRPTEEIVVDEPVVLVVLLVGYFELTKRHIAYGGVKEAVREICFLKALHGDAVLLVELLRDPAGNAVQLHAVQPAFRHAVGQHTDKETDAAGRLQNVAGLEAHVFKRLINAANDRRRGIERGQGGFPRGGVFVLGQQSLQLAVPAVLFIEAVGKAAPAHITGEDFLFSRCRKAVFFFELFKQPDGGDIVPKTLARRSNAERIVGNAEVVTLRLRYLRVEDKALRARFALRLRRL